MQVRRETITQVVVTFSEDEASHFVQAIGDMEANCDLLDGLYSALKEAEVCEPIED